MALAASADLSVVLREYYQGVDHALRIGLQDLVQYRQGRSPPPAPADHDRFYDQALARAGSLLQPPRPSPLEVRSAMAAMAVAFDLRLCDEHRRQLAALPHDGAQLDLPFEVVGVINRLQPQLQRAWQAWDKRDLRGTWTVHQQHEVLVASSDAAFVAAQAHVDRVAGLLALHLLSLADKIARSCLSIANAVLYLHSGEAVRPGRAYHLPTPLAVV